MPSPTASAMWVQGKGEEQIIYLRIEQQEKFPPTAQAKGTALEGPNDQQRLHKGFCSSEQFAVLSAWKTHCLSGFNYGGTDFNFRSQFSLTFPPPTHTRMENGVGGWGGGGWGRGLGHHNGAGIPDLGRKWTTQHMVVESGRKWTQFSLFRALTCYESKILMI